MPGLVWRTGHRRRVLEMTSECHLEDIAQGIQGTTSSHPVLAKPGLERPTIHHINPHQHHKSYWRGQVTVKSFFFCPGTPQSNLVFVVRLPCGQNLQMPKPGVIYRDFVLAAVAAVSSGTPMSLCQTASMANQEPLTNTVQQKIHNHHVGAVSIVVECKRKTDITGLSTFRPSCSVHVHCLRVSLPLWRRSSTSTREPE